MLILVVVRTAALQEEKEVRTAYTSNPRSLLVHTYTASFWVARKIVDRK
jgi:hypothetical protein